LVIGGQRGLIFLNPALFLLGPDNKVQAAFQCLGQIDAQTARFVE